jgi:kynureninase
MKYENSLSFALEMDSRDPLKGFRSEFLIPKTAQGKDVLYFSGNSLGLQPKKARDYIQEELEDWAKLGVEGHLHARHPWLPYHENLTEMTARLVGAKPIEVVVMNTLSVNLHLMMVSFYRPTKERFKILVEAGAFPSDQYAVASQARFHGYDPKDAIVELKPRSGETLIRDEDILETIQKQGKQIALILLGNVNYLTGQAFNIPEITKAGHAQGCMVGFDLAHGAGNLKVQLHDEGPDFAVWCSYKYLNSGPGALSGCFVHERHARANLPRFAGWWGHNKSVRFKMGPDFEAIPGAEGWQLSNPPIFQLAALRASMELFDRATMSEIRKKGDLLTGYLEYLLLQLNSKKIEITTPREVHRRGCQLSLKVKEGAKALSEELVRTGIISDFREPDIVRVAPAPLYNQFSDVFQFVQVLKKYA